MFDPPVTSVGCQPLVCKWPTRLTQCARGMNPSCPLLIVSVQIHSGASLSACLDEPWPAAQAGWKGLRKPFSAPNAGRAGG